jgi:hypothetical protein
MSNSRTQARLLGDLMCSVTKQILWQPASDWVTDRLPGSTLMCRVGSGQATYHRFDSRIKQHQITYGTQMIKAKHQPDTAQGWLSSREILGRGYFNGELSTLNLLAHTCCHEFAHLLQHCAGHRFRGSVHNRYFYSTLDKLHCNGQASSVRQALSERAQETGLHLSEMPFEFLEPNHQTHQWYIGETVSFKTSESKFYGEIVRVNRKTCTVDGTGKSRGVRYRVPMQMLRKTN